MAAEAAQHRGTLALLDNTEEALAAYRRAIELDPADADSWKQLRHLQRRKEELQAADESANRKVAELGESLRDRPVLIVSSGSSFEFEPEMVIVPAGEFFMGSPPSEPERKGYEGPQHLVRIEHPFAIGKYEVTFEEYDAFAQATGRDKSNEDWGRSQQPVINVSWEDATAYTKWLSQ